MKINAKLITTRCSFPLKKKSTDKKLFVSLDRKKSPPEGCTEEIDSNYAKGLGKVFLKKSAVS